MKTQQLKIDNGFLKPFPRDVLRQDILNLSMLHASLAFMFADAAPLGRAYYRRDVETHLALPDFDLTPKDAGLTYDDVRWSDFAQALERQYNFAFFALDAGPAGPLKYETTHTWAACSLLDLQHSMMAFELESYTGGFWGQSIVNCLYVCELANARVFLEDGETFTSLRGAINAKEDTTTSIEGLTVRQMSLLAGMEEMTIRTAASRKGPNPLESMKDGTRTVFDRAVAKQWLISKGRYLPVHTGEEPVPYDVLSRPYSNTREFVEMVQTVVDAGVFDRAEYRNAMKSAGLKTLSQLEAAHLKNVELMHPIALSLGLPERMFAVRAKEAAIREELALLERQEKELRESLSE